MFHALNEEHLKQIVDIQLVRLRARLGERHIEFDVDRRGTHPLSKGGLRFHVRSPSAEARHSAQIETPLAKRILGGELHGGQTVHVDADTAGAVFNIQVRLAGNGGSS